MAGIRRACDCGPNGAGIEMAITRKSSNSIDWGTSSPETFLHTLTSGDNRIIVIAVMIEANGNPGTVSATYGGVSASLVVSRVVYTSGQYRNVYLFELREASLPEDGGQTVSVSCTGSPSTLAIAGCCAEYGNVSQDGPVGYDDDGGYETESSIDVSMVATDLSVLAVCGGNDAVSFSFGESQTELFDADVGYCRAGLADLIASGSVSSLSVTASAQQNQAVVGAWWHDVEWGSTPGAGLFFGKGLS